MQILVVGMHRSGTSMFTRLINQLGAYAGAEGEFTDTGIGSENPKGYWERRDVRATNEALLSSLGCDWDDVLNWGGAAPPNQAITAFRRSAQLIALQLDANRPWVIKDPRLCLTLRHWLPVLELPVPVVVLRDPLEVAVSLHARNEFPIELGLALWEAYYRSATEALAGKQVILVDHRDLLADPVSAASQLLDQLNGAGVRKLAAPADAELEAFVDKGLYRSRVDQKSREGAGHDAFMLYSEILESRGRIDGFAGELSARSREALAGHRRVLNQLQRRFGPAIRALGADRSPDVVVGGSVGQGDPASRHGRPEADHEMLLLQSKIAKLEIELATAGLMQARADEDARRQLGAMQAERLQEAQASQKRDEQAQAEVTQWRGRFAELEREHADLSSAHHRQLEAERAKLDTTDKQRRLILQELRATMDVAARIRGHTALVDQALRRSATVARDIRASVRWRVGNALVRVLEILLLRSRGRDPWDTLLTATAEGRESVRAIAGGVDVQTGAASRGVRMGADGGGRALPSGEREMAAHRGARQMTSSDPSATAGNAAATGSLGRSPQTVAKLRTLLLQYSGSFKVRALNAVVGPIERLFGMRHDALEDALQLLSRLEASSSWNANPRTTGSALSHSSKMRSAEKTKEGHAGTTGRAQASQQAGSDAPLTAAPAAIQQPRRGVVYTAVAGGYDALKQPEFIWDDCDYVVFSDRDIPEPGVWQVRRMDYHNADPTRSARFVKLHPQLYFPEYDFSLWIDANLLLCGTGETLRAAMRECDMLVFPHPHRTCVYEEAEEVIRRGGLDDATIVQQHMSMLRDIDYPEANGLFETNVLFRRHNSPMVVDLMHEWWRLVENGSKRDQLSFNVACWRTKVDVGDLAQRGISVRNHPDLRRYQHGDGSDYSASALSDTVRSRMVEVASGVIRPPQAGSGSTPITVRTDVVVCVHNAPDDVLNCLESVYPTLGDVDNLIVVDDGSNEPTRKLLAEFVEGRDRMQVIRRPEAGGYTVAANAGYQASHGDFVVFLNSDTIVPPAWLEKLRRLAFSSKEIGIVGPLSNAASWQSVPRTLDDAGKLAVNTLPESVSVETADAWCMESSVGRVFVPLLNGFCFGVKRDVFDAIGGFDEESFPRGYGEENDFCFRAADAGFLLAVTTDCYVYHAKSKSYSSATRDELAQAGSRAFRAKFPKARVDNAIVSARENPLLAEVRSRFELRLQSWDLDQANDVPDLGRFVLPMPLPEASGGIGAYDLEADDLRLNDQIVNGPWPFTESPPGSALWFVPAFEHALRGGIRTIFTVAEDWSRTWGTFHHFVIYGNSVDIDQVFSQLQQYFPDLRFNLIPVMDATAVADLPPTDLGICTLWNSAFHLVKYNRCRAKMYFAQDYEPSFYRAGTTYGLIQETYRFGFNVIANSIGVGGRVREHTPRVDSFDPGVDSTLFCPSSVALGADEARRVIFYGRPRNPRNAFELGMESLRMLKARLGDRVDIVSVGADFDPADYGCDGAVRNLGVLGSMQEVAELYSRARAGLVFMFSAHPSYQPLEYMASGCVTVTNENYSNRWLLRDRDNCLLTRAVPSEIAEKLTEVVTDDSLYARIRDGGLRTIASLTWDRTLSRVREIVMHPTREGNERKARVS